MGYRSRRQGVMLYFVSSNVHSITSLHIVTILSESTPSFPRLRPISNTCRSLTCRAVCYFSRPNVLRVTLKATSVPNHSGSALMPWAHPQHGLHHGVSALLAAVHAAMVYVFEPATSLLESDCHFDALRVASNIHELSV